MEGDELQKRFGLAVAARRRVKRWSQERLGDATGVSRHEISLIERGRIACSIVVAYRLAKVFETTLDLLIGVEPPNERQLRLAEIVRAVPDVALERAAVMLDAAFGMPPPRVRTYQRAGRRR